MRWFNIFNKKSEIFGIEKDKNGNLNFTLTEEEEQEVENTSKMFEVYALYPDFVDSIQNGSIAFALSNYAQSQVAMSEWPSNNENRKKFIEKAIASTSKAYSYYQLPIYLYDLACFMEFRGEADESKQLFSEFLKKQSEFKPNQIDEWILMDRDIDAAIKDASVKVK